MKLYQKEHGYKTMCKLNNSPYHYQFTKNADGTVPK